MKRTTLLVVALLAFAGLGQAQLTNTQANSTLDSILGTAFVSLHTADPGDSCTNEVTGGSYARQSATFSAAASSTTSTTADLTYADMPAVTVTHVAVWSLASGGTCKMRGALTASQAVDAGQTFEIPTGDLDVTFN